MYRCLTLVLPLLLLAGCKPPAADDYVERTRLPERRSAPAAPLASPDTEGAVWAPAANDGRLLYGLPGQPPLFAMECLADELPPRLQLTRYAPADARAKAMLALIGNGHIARVGVDAVQVGNLWLWQGQVAAQDAALDGLLGARGIEATIPGAGSMMLNPNPLPGDLIARCRAASAPPAAPADPG